MSVHYKFKSALEYDTVTFDGLHISVKDLKNAIIQQKRIGKSTDFDLQVTNAQTKEVYEDENTLIPKNTSLLIARIPNIVQSKSKQWEGYSGDSVPLTKLDDAGPIAKAVDLSCLDAPEDDKIKAMMSQSTQDYDPSNYIKIRGANQVGAVPPNYRCYKCHQTGHWIKDCQLGQLSEPVEIKKSTGIPRSFMVPVEGPQVLGAMMTPNGSYAVPVLDHQAYNQKQQPPQPVPEPKPDIPEDLLCSICSDLLTDAVMIPCCGNSFCDECIRNCLLESEEHECPDCHEKDISPGTLIPNRFLRTSVANFKNTTGYVKKIVYKPKPILTEIIPKKSQTPPLLEQKNAETDKNIEELKSDLEEKTIISEADSTEQQAKNNVDFSKDVEVSEKQPTTKKSESLQEGPPGVSPRDSPRVQTITNRVYTSPREQRTGGSRPRKHHSNRENTPPRRRNTRRRSPSYSDTGPDEDRPGTPTVDEPGGSSNTSYNPNGNRNNNYGNAPPGTVPPMMNIGPPPIQGPPPQLNFPPNQPPVGPGPYVQGPPPNFRLPPPGSAPPYMPPGTYPPPRPLYDPTRPPLTGPPANFMPNFPPGPRHHREYDRRMRNRTPPGVIDDPLAAFNKMLREKDERERRAKQRNMRRSYSISRSRSRSRSFSRSPVRRRSKSPRRRKSRSRSRSFTMSRSRSRSYTGSMRGSLRGSPYRDFSPRHSPRRRGPSRYRSPPVRSPPRHRHVPDRRDRDYERDRDKDRDFDRGGDFNNRNRNRDMPDRDRNRGGGIGGGNDTRDRGGGGADYRYYDNNYDDRNRGGKPSWVQGIPPRGPPDSYFPPQAMQQQHPYPPNRYPGPSRDYQPYMNKNDQHLQPIIAPQQMQHLQPVRRYDDIAPPGVEEPPIPGLEDKIEPFEEKKPEHPIIKERFSPKPNNDAPRDNNNREKDKPERRSERNRDDRRRRTGKQRSATPEKTRSQTPKRKINNKEDESPEKHKRRRTHDESLDRDRKREHSEEDKFKKSKDRKKKKERRDSEKKKHKDRREKHRSKKEEKEKERERERGKKIKVEVKQHELKEETIESEKELSYNREKTPEKVTIETELLQPLPEVIEQHSESLYDDVGQTDVALQQNKDDDNLYEMEPEEVIEENYNTQESDVTEREIHKQELESSKEYEDSEKDILELHLNDIDLKAELDNKNEMLAPVPEKSRWEFEDDNNDLLSPNESKTDLKVDKSGKVTNEVLKRAENAIFAKAINAIRPIEIKKISSDRAKLYSGEREIENKNEENIQVTILSNEKTERKRIEAPQQPPVKLSVKDRLGKKIDDPDKIILLDRSPSPFSRRVELEERPRHNRSRRSHSRDRQVRNRSVRREHRREEFIRRDLALHRRERRDEHRNRPRIINDDRRIKRGRHSRSPSEERKDKKKKRDKKVKKDKTKRHQKEDDDEKKVDSSKSEMIQDTLKPKTATEKRKPTLDEANFEPDYDLDSDSEKEEGEHIEEVVPIGATKETDKKSSSSSESSDSSSEEERKKKKHRKHKKKKSKKESSSSSSESESDSSEDEREKRKKRHKKKLKKKKKSKHK